MKRLTIKSKKMAIRLNPMVTHKDGSTDQSGTYEVDGRSIPFQRHVEGASVKFKMDDKTFKHITSGKAL